MIIAQRTNRLSDLGVSSNPIDFIVETAKAYIKTYTDKFYQPPNCSEIAAYIKSVKPSGMVIAENDIQQAAFIMYVYDVRTGTYEDWHYALGQLIHAAPTATDAEITAWAVDMGLSYIMGYNPSEVYPSSQVTLTKNEWANISEYAISSIPFLNAKYGANLVLTQAMIDANLSNRKFVKGANPPTATNADVLNWALDASLDSIGKLYVVTQNTPLTSTEWASVSSFMGKTVTDLNLQYGTNLALTQAMIDQSLADRKYYKAGTSGTIPEPEPKPEPNPPGPEPNPILDNKMLMLVLFAGAFFLAIFPGQSSVPEGESNG